jgi:hypothetical protein
LCSFDVGINKKKAYPSSAAFTKSVASLAIGASIFVVDNKTFYYYLKGLSITRGL